MGGSMTCEGCAKPNGGLYVIGCRPCSLRDLATGPMFWASMREGRLTKEYRAALLALGGDAAAVHAEVKAAAKGILVGSVNA